MCEHPTLRPVTRALARHVRTRVCFCFRSPCSCTPRAIWVCDSASVFAEARVCTDVLCCLLFVLAMALFALVSSIGYALGDPTRLLFGSDHRGRRCGVGDLTDKSKVYFPRLSKDLLLNQALLSSPWALEAHLYGVCVEECPTTGRDGAPVPATVDDPGGEQRSWPVGEPTLTIFNRCVPAETARSSSSAYCALPTCWDARQECAERVPGHGDREGLWRLTGEAAAAAACAREIDVSLYEVARTPNSGGLVALLSQVRHPHAVSRHPSASLGAALP